MVIAFFSPVRGQAGTTGNLLSTAIIETICQKKKVMVLESFLGESDMEKYLLKIPRQHNGKEIQEGHGMDTVIRNIKLSGLEKSRFNESCYSFFEGKLCILPASRQRETEIFTQEMETYLPAILNFADTLFDYVFVDIKDGKERISQYVQKRADCVAVNLSQSPAAIETYFKNGDTNEKKKIYLIGNYDKKSQYNRRNLSYLFPKMNRRNTVVIPYNTQVKDALESADLLRFHRKYAGCDKKNKNYKYVQGIQAAGKLFQKREGAGCD
ncbi:MAG: hypothetical protein RR056_05275 [Acetivibrio sp.]